MTMAETKENITPTINEKFNSDNILLRSVIAGLLGILNNTIDYSQNWADNITEKVEVPWMYDLGTSDERFMQDNYTFFGSECFGKRMINGSFNSEPRGYLKMTGARIESNSITNRFVQGTYLKDVGGKLMSYTAHLFSMPLTVNFDCKVVCDNIITSMKIEQAIREAFFKNKSFFVLFRGMRIGCTAGFPEEYGNEHIRTTEYSFESPTKKPIITFSLAVETYHPVFDKTTEMESSKRIMGFGWDIFVKSKGTEKAIKLKNHESSLIYPAGTPFMIEWDYSSMDSVMENVSIFYKDKNGEEVPITQTTKNSMYYIWNIPSDFSKFVQPTIRFKNCDVISEPVIKIIPDPKSKLITEKSFVLVKNGYIIPKGDSFVIPIEIEYKDEKNKLVIVRGYNAILDGNQLNIERPFCLDKDMEAHKYKNEVNPRVISLIIRYTNDYSICDEISNLLIL